MTEENWRLRLSPLAFRSEREAYRWMNDTSDAWCVSDDATTLALINTDETTITHTPEGTNKGRSLTLPTKTFMTLIESGYFIFARYHHIEAGDIEEDDGEVFESFDDDEDDVEDAD